MAANPGEWTKELEADLAALDPTCGGRNNGSQKKGFRVDRGNKLHSGWCLTAINRDQAAKNLLTAISGGRLNLPAHHVDYTTRYTTGDEPSKFI